MFGTGMDMSQIQVPIKHKNYVIPCTKQSGGGDWNILKRLNMQWSVAWSVLLSGDIVLWNELDDYVHMVFIFSFFVVDENLRRWMV